VSADTRASRLASLFAVDLRSLALLRIALASLLLVDLFARSRDLSAFYGEAGTLPVAELARLEPRAALFSVHVHFSGSALALGALFALAAAGLSRCSWASGRGWRPCSRGTCSRACRRATPGSRRWAATSCSACCCSGGCAGFARAVCREWEGDHPGAVPLVALEIWLVTEPTTDAGAGPPEAATLGRFACAGP
jgi:hypothetical protein